MCVCVRARVRVCVRVCVRHCDGASWRRTTHHKLRLRPAVTVLCVGDIQQCSGSTQEAKVSPDHQCERVAAWK